MTELNHWLPSAWTGPLAPACVAQLFAVLRGQRTRHIPKLFPSCLSLASLLGMFVRYIQRRSFYLRCDRSGRDAGRAAVLGRDDKCSFGCRSGEWSQIIRPAPSTVRLLGVDEGVGGYFASYSYTDSRQRFNSIKQKMSFRSKTQMRFCTSWLLLASILRRKVARRNLAAKATKPNLPGTLGGLKSIFGTPRQICR